jgi:flagellar hook-associated protein 3 FlgL
MMYNRHVDNMNNALSAYMESHLQNTTQKKVNRPSDDPAGMAHILQYRHSIAESSQFMRNIDTAKGWLSQADNTLLLLDTTISKIRVLAEQAATGTLSPDNRLQISFQLRELFGQVLNLSNTRFDGKTIFAGQSYTTPAYEEGLTVDCSNAAFNASLQAALNANPPEWPVFNGPIRSTTMVRFTNPGGVIIPPGLGGANYEYSSDGGNTWRSGVLAAGSNSIDMGGPMMTLPAGTVVPGFDPDDDRSTTLIVRPAAIYQGADNRAPAVVSVHGPSGLAPQATGNFPTDIRVRFDQDFTIPAAVDFKYSYSTDEGKTWIHAQAPAGATRLAVPGGFLDLQPTGAAINQNDFVIIQPQRTNLDYEMNYDFLSTVNHNGKDIFGGLYMSRDEFGNPVQYNAFDGDGRNLFETIGRLIAACEINDQTGVQRELENLTSSLKTALTYQARIGGRINALDVNREILESTKDDQTARMSYLEDANLQEVLTRLAQQELAYSTVLKSSSMIMQLNLTKYI